VILEQLIFGMAVAVLVLLAAAVPAGNGRNRGGDVALVRCFRRGVGCAGLLVVFPDIYGTAILLLALLIGLLLVDRRYRSRQGVS
jgi:hypothetical protein